MFQVIFGVFLELITLRAANGNIPGCHFLDTVNITSSQRLQNDSYLYQDLEVPASLTGQYDYITTELKYNETKKSHLRGCVCHVMPCIWICCRFKDWDASTGKCTDGLMEELREINPFLKVILSNGSIVKRNLLRDFMVLRDRMRWLDTWIEDEYTLFENGSVLFNSSKTINFRGYDCLHPNQFTSGNTQYFVAAFHEQFYHEKPRIPLPGKNELMWLSNMFLILTIAVYLYVKKLRNLHGKCFICYMIISLMYFIQQLLESILIGLQLCGLQGYFIYFFVIAKFSWLLALSHQLWRGFTLANRAESAYSFGVYSIFAWGLPAILTGVLFLIEHIWDGDPHKVEWVPGIGWQNCDFKAGWSLHEYITLPMTVLLALNTTLFILTIIRIISVKLSLRHFSDKDERARNLHSRMQTYNVFLRLVILLDIQWSLRLIFFFADWNLLVQIFRYWDACIGIIIFFMFVTKRTTLKLLVESIRNRSD